MKTMMLVCCLLALSVAFALPPNILNRNNEKLNQSRNVVENVFLDLLEELRQTMLVGSDDIPVLDPFHQDHLELDLEDLGIRGHLNIRDLVANYLSTFVVDNLRFGLLTWRLDFEGHIPVLEILAENYELWATVDGIVATGYGPAIIRMKELRLVGTAQFLPSIGIGSLGLQMQSCHLTLHLGGWESAIKNLVGEAPTDQFVNQVLANLMPDLVKYYEADISQVLNEIVLEFANDFLGDLVIEL